MLLGSVQNGLCSSCVCFDGGIPDFSTKERARNVVLLAEAVFQVALVAPGYRDQEPVKAKLGPDHVILFFMCISPIFILAHTGLVRAFTCPPNQFAAVFFR